MNSPYVMDNLVNGLVSSKSQRSELINTAADRKSLVIPERFIADCEMLSTGAYTPLRGFMTKPEADSVIKNLCLPEGHTWGIPIILAVSGAQLSGIRLGDEVNLLDAKKTLIAVMKIEDKYKYDKKVFCKNVFKTIDLKHPGVNIVMKFPEVFIGGPIKLINRPKRAGVPEKYYLDPKETRAEFKKRKWSTIAAFQTRNPIHRAHEFLIKSSLEYVDGVLIHPLVGETKSDDIPASVRVRCYEVLVKNYFNKKKVMLSVLPTFMRYAGPREAINHAIIRKNYGCTHFIVGRDHAGVGGYYGAYEAQELLSRYAGKIGIKILNFDHVYYCKKCKGMATHKTCFHPKGHHIVLSGTLIREILKNKGKISNKFSRKEVVDILEDWAKEVNV